MKYIKKLTIISLIIFIFINCFSICNYRTYASVGTWSDLQGKVNEFFRVGSEKAGDLPKGDDTNDIFSNLKFLGRVLTTIGAGILVIITILTGIRYITATPETMGKIKSQAIGLVVAAFVIFGAYFIWSMVLDVVSKF